jgi:hypothetical protein
MRNIPRSLLAPATVVLVAGSVIGGIESGSLGWRPKNSGNDRMKSESGVEASSGSGTGHTIGARRLQGSC